MKSMKNNLLFACFMSGLLLLGSSCTRIGRFAGKRADRAAYRIVEDAQQAALGRSMPFSISSEEMEQIQALLNSTNDQPELLSLSDALAIAIANSRSYQRRKEDLFIQALRLTETHKDFGLQYSADATAGTSMSTYKSGPKESFGDKGVDVNVGAGVVKTLYSGATMTLGASQNILQYYTDPDSSTTDNALTFKIVQPLLRGFGPLVSREPLRQAERDMIYAVRSFKRFQQSFVISIASDYYDVLRRRDSLENARKNYESAIANREQNEAYARAGRIAEFEAAQARQRELSAADNLVSARAKYLKALDDFRFALGLPIDLNVEPDAAELERLAKQGLVQLNIDLDEGLASAVSNRLDLITQRERVEDGDRKLEIAQRDFLPKLDVTYDVRKEFDSAGAPPDDLDWRQNLSARLVLPLDWTERRNDFRIAQINLERNQRAFEETEADIRRNVRDFWRQLERQRSVYENRLLSVELAERQVENTTMLLKLGRAKTRDQLEAEDDLLSSRNDATSALVDYTIGRLQFWNAIERFEIDPQGMWYDKPQESESSQ
jgi:outer membrane protein TolC